MAWAVLRREEGGEAGLRKGDMSIFGRTEECAVEMGLVERGDGEDVGVRLGDVVQGLSLL